MQSSTQRAPTGFISTLPSLLILQMLPAGASTALSQAEAAPPHSPEARGCRLGLEIHPKSALSRVWLWKCPAWPLSARGQPSPAGCFLCWFVQHLVPDPTELGPPSATGRIKGASGKAAAQKNQLMGRKRYWTWLHVAPRLQIFQGLIMCLSSTARQFFSRTLI